MSAILDRVREKYPQYKDVSEDELALRIGTKYPAYLDSDDDFKKEFQGAVASRSIKAATSAGSALLGVLTNPAVGEAAEQGREDIAFQKATQPEAVPQTGEQRGARDYQSLVGTQFEPGIARPKEEALRPMTLGERVVSGLQRAPVVGKAFTPTKLPYEIEQERDGITDKTNPANALRDLLGGLIKPEAMALLLTGAGEAQIAKLSPALASAVKRVISGYFAWEGAKGVGEALPEAFKPGKTFSERLGYLTTAAGSGAIALGAGSHALSEAAVKAKDVAPMTAAAVGEQSVQPHVQSGLMMATASRTKLVEESMLPWLSEEQKSEWAALPEDVKQRAAFLGVTSHTFRGLIDRAKTELAPKPPEAPKAKLPALPPPHTTPQPQAQSKSDKDTGQILPTGAIEQKPPQEAPEAPKATETPSTPQTPAVAQPEAKAEPSKPEPNWQITAASYTHPETGEITTGKNHIEAAREQGVEAPKIPQQRHTPEFGYEVQDPLTGETKTVSRDEGEAIARKTGQLLNEPTLGKLHSNEVWYAIPFEKRQRLNQLGLKEQDIADLESGRERVSDIVDRKLPGVGPDTGGGPDHAQALEEARIQAVADIEQILNEKGKQNAKSTGKEAQKGSEQAQELEQGAEERLRVRDTEKHGVEAKPGEVAEAKEPPKRVAQALSSTKRFNKETENNGPDILSWMNENMKMLSKASARLKWGRAKFRENASLYDDSVTLQKTHHNLIYDAKGSTPDQVAQAAYEDGIISEPSVNVLWKEIDKASKARANWWNTAAREEAYIAEEAKQHTDWLKATKEGEQHISADQLKVGDSLEVEGQKVEVTEIDPDTGDVTLKDGKKFGTQKLSEGQSIYVEKYVEAPMEEADFAPEPAAPEAEPITKEEKFQAYLKKVDAEHAERQAAIDANVAAAGTEGSVEFVNKKNPDKKLIVSPEPAEPGKWRVTGFDERGPWGHNVFDSREAAIRAASGEAFSDQVKGPPYYQHGEYEIKRVASPEKVEAKAETPKLRSGEKSTGELFQGEDQPFNLMGEKGTDAERIAREKAEADQRASEAKALEEKQQLPLSEKPKETPPTQETTTKQPEVGEKPPEKGAAKYRLKNEGPQTYSVVERLPATEVEIANGEQPVRVKNDKTGAESVVLESQLQEVKERTAAEREAAKGMTKRELDDELRRMGMDPREFSNMEQKRAALKRAKAKGKLAGPGTPSIYQGPDPKAQIEQLTESFQGIKGQKVPWMERMRRAWDLGERISLAKDAVGEAVAGLKSTGDYLINQWSGDMPFDQMLKAKGDLSAELEKRGWTVRRFAKQIKKSIPDEHVRAAISKWIDAGGSMSELLWGANHTKPEYRQAYIDAMHLSGDNLVAAQNIRNYFESRLQEAIDAGVLEHGIDDYIHRIFEKDPYAANQMIGFVNSGILSRNPALAKKRIFQMDWEAERLGYKVVQDFLPRITDYETSLSRAIAAREFIRKMVGYTDDNGNRVPGMLASDGRPVVDVAGMGVPVEDQQGVREATLINPSFKPEDKTNPRNNRNDYKERPEYAALRKWKWATTDAQGKPIFVQGNVLVHPEFEHRVDALLKPSFFRGNQTRLQKVLHAGMAASSTMKQTMLDMSLFHQVQIGVHAIEHRVNPFRLSKDIDFTSDRVQGLLKGGLTIGGDYHAMQREGLVGRSLSQLIPGIGPLMKTYHEYLFQDFIPRIKVAMAEHALDRNMKRYSQDLRAGRKTMDDVYKMTAEQANAAFGGLNYIMLERSKTAQDLSRMILLAPDFLEARTRFAAQAFKKGGKSPFGPLGSNEQRTALLLGALTLYTLARVGNQILNGQMHNEPENAFSIIHNGKAYSLRTVQGDILHLIEQPIQFWMSRLNPMYGRTTLEMATGRDYFGRKRSALEQLYDFVSTAVPISLRTSNERKLWESFMNGLGINARRYADTDQAFKLAQKWKEKNKIGSRGEFIYDSEKDPMRPLKVALSNSDEAGAVKAIKDIIDSKKSTTQKMSEYFDRYANMPFTGSFENDKKFVASLTEDEKKTVQAAREHKKSIRKLYRNALGIYQQVKSSQPSADQMAMPEPGRQSP